MFPPEPKMRPEMESLANEHKRTNFQITKQVPMMTKHLKDRIQQRKSVRLLHQSKTYSPEWHISIDMQLGSYTHRAAGPPEASAKFDLCTKTNDGLI